MQFQDVGMGALMVINDEEDKMPVGKIEQLTQTQNGSNEFRNSVKEDLIQNKVIDPDAVGPGPGDHKGETSDGTSANYYKFPTDAREIQDLISYKDMNAQMGEIGRTWYRYGECSHSDKLREINKILFYANAEKTRLIKYCK